MPATISYSGTGIKKEVMKLLQKRGKKTVNMCKNDGAPVNDTDIAAANGDLCLDYTNDDLYVASNVVAETTTTWTKIVD